MTIQQILRKSTEPEIELLLGAVLKQSKEFLYLHPNISLTPPQERKFNKLLNDYQSGIPVAYLLRYKNFYGLRFKVNRFTLIPRPESEWLVEKALEILKGKPDQQIIDIGTGSGCLAICIKKYSPQVKVTATDINNRTLLVAKQNSQNHSVKVKFKNQYLLQGDSMKYDLIIANLPYVPKNVYQKLHKGLMHEPKFALIDRKQDFDLYQKLLSQVKNNLKPQATLLLEIDPSMKLKLTAWCKKNWTTATLKFTKDIHGLWRFCEIRNLA